MYVFHGCHGREHTHTHRTSLEWCPMILDPYESEWSHVGFFDVLNETNIRSSWERDHVHTLYLYISLYIYPYLDTINGHYWTLLFRNSRYER